MSVSYMTQVELDNALSSHGNLDASVRNEVINYLAGIGAFSYPDVDGPSAIVRTNIWVPPLGPTEQVLDLHGVNNVVNTTGSSVQAIIADTAGNATLTVQGDQSVFIATGNGNNTVYLSDAGDDTVMAGAGNDTIAGGAGDSEIHGGAGNDSLYGGSGDDSLYGGDGDDWLQVGSSSQQHLYAGAGDDTLVDFWSGDDTLTAGEGNDVLWGFGADTLEGAAGIVGHAELHGGAWSTLYSNSQAGGYNILGSGSVAGTANILWGGAGADTLYGGGGADILHAGAGDNLLIAGGGHNQHLIGGAGDDTLVSYVWGAGDDTLTAGTGNDILWGFGADTLEGAAGIVGHAELHGGVWSTLYSNSLAGGYNILGSGSVGGTANTLYGGAGNDTLYGGGGQDTLIGGSGQNWLIAGTGTHQLLQAGDGPGSVLYDPYSGSDTLLHYATLQGGSGNDTLWGAGGDTLIGGGGNDELWAFHGSESMEGGAGDDVFHIETHQGNDTIDGGTGTNIVGFAGRATTDVQTFSFDNGSNTWTVVFGNGQTITMTNVQALYFTDGVQHLT